MITRNNYEEFFLLYVDNELSPADRKAVERFVDDNPDLKEEMDLLLQCRISPDEAPSLPGKELLFRSEGPIHPGNYETWFLDYIDGQLDAASIQAVIDFVRRHPEKNIELQQLQRTVSVPDTTIVFPDKELLYRKEERRRIVWMPFARLAAAALILGALGLLVFHPFQKDRHLVSDSKPRSDSGKSSVAAAPVTITPSSTNEDTSSTASDPQTNNTPATPHTTKKYIAAVTPHTVESLYPTKNGDGTQGEPSSTRQGTSSSTRQETSSSTGQRTSNPTGVETVTPAMVKVDPARTATTVETNPGRQLAVADPKTIDRNSKLSVTAAMGNDQAQHDATGNLNTSFATQALLSQASYQDDDAGEEMTSPRKNKLRGIFRKVTRVLEKPAAREDDDNKKVTIGGFQFALK